jgi:hypothetical protein
MVRNTTNENLRKWLTLRLKAFRMVEFLEDGIAQYQEIYGSQPPSLEALVEGGILQAIPPDPYGGKFYLDKSGRVQTTSEFAQGKRSSANPGQ